MKCLDKVDVLETLMLNLDDMLENVTLNLDDVYMGRRCVERG